MKLNDAIYKSPEMSEEKLLKLMSNYKRYFSKEFVSRITSVYNQRHNSYETDICKMILDEWDNIQKRESYLTKSQRDQISGFVGMCLIQMTKDDGGNSTDSNDGNSIKNV